MDGFRLQNHCQWVEVVKNGFVMKARTLGEELQVALAASTLLMPPTQLSGTVFSGIGSDSVTPPPRGACRVTEVISLWFEGLRVHLLSSRLL